MYKFDVEIETNNIVGGIKQYFADNKMQNAIIGISGGKDSTIVAKLCCMALGKGHVYGIMMPNGNQKDISDSEKVIKILGINSYTVNIGNTYNSLKNSFPLDTDNKVFNSNTPARIRMTTLYGFSNIIKNSLVMNTCNYSEDCMGYSTFYGDSAGDYAPIRYYTVTEVRSIGDYLGLPKELVHKIPDDGMCGFSDEAKLSNELGFDFTYERLDKFLRNLPNDFSDIEISKIMKKFESNKYKIKTINISSKLPIFCDEIMKVRLEA